MMFQHGSYYDEPQNLKHLLVTPTKHLWTAPMTQYSNSVSWSEWSLVDLSSRGVPYQVRVNLTTKEVELSAPAVVLNDANKQFINNYVAQVTS